MENQSNIKGDQNIVIQGVTDSTITVNVNGKVQELHNKLDALQGLLEKIQASTFQTANKSYRIDTLTETNFGFLLGQINHEKTLPLDLAENIITDDNIWVQSLQRELTLLNVKVGNKPWSIFEHYGWLIEAFLQKMGTATGRKRTLRRMSFMAEAFQGSLRYLCYIQVAQILQLEEIQKNDLITSFIEQDESKSDRYDYLNLLLVATDMLKGMDVFMPEISDFVYNLTDTKDDFYGNVLFLEKQRDRLLSNEIPEDKHLDRLLDEYLTALVFWLRQISFIAKYRLVSIKDINLAYRLGSAKNFVHLYGELHGIYVQAMNTGEDYNMYSIEESYTYNQSVLLFKGTNVGEGLERIKTDPPLSLSPLIIDQSVYSSKSTQTPEIYYYKGRVNKQFHFALYKNELAFGEHQDLQSNKKIKVKRQNINQPKLDDLFEQLEQVFAPFKSLKR